ncbi:hypothetical protein T190115A13A_70008 [Tenacibaculum sp. 190524A02b]|uniref:Uncharacterized protein n=1 Tax=Tenacibaculum vairaonense TaxID=3137860 RepID=A0ABP1FCY5_9FLAO
MKVSFLIDDNKLATTFFIMLNFLTLCSPSIKVLSPFISLYILAIYLFLKQIHVDIYLKVYFLIFFQKYVIKKENNLMTTKKLTLLFLHFFSKNS